MGFLDLPARPWIVGHRGVRGPVPENTVAALHEAVSQGADMVELDLQLTADGRWVVFHDARVRDASGEARAIERSSLAEIEEWRPLWHGEGGARAYRIPTLEEVLAAAPESLPLNLELKRHDLRSDVERLADALVEVAGNGRRLLVSSFDDELLLAIRRRLPGLPLAPLGGGDAAWLRLVDLARELEASALHVSRRLVAKELESGRLVRLSEDLPILVYTVNRPAEARRLAAHGVSGFFSDRPGLLRRAFEPRDRAAPAPGS